LSLNEQNCWLMTCQTISSEDIVLTGAKQQLLPVYGVGWW
jgi:hypothetical protein